MNYEIIPTHPYIREAKALAKKYPSLKNDLLKLFEQLQINPQSGESLGKSCYKIRISIASKGRGKSGGARVITHVRITSEKIYLLSIYDKSDQEIIEDGEISQRLDNIE
ncbi:type II toxin-antitoxin system RelE/ParE family toxin [Larkinella terrae]|uniref:Addiction module toxin RelE n=1 Tax=Larkinella terrae TaxID=2025311 RepID=A0A7K0ELJ8_9BACT|nr:type II toxin-antitoxin system RelE/ParE family toxin [Larkinella terrae]MRS62654.1 hypothetical protein [Larkinella terrae]